METRRSKKKEESWNRHMRGTESLWYYGSVQTPKKSRHIGFKAADFFQVDSTVQDIVFVSVKTVLDLGYSPRGGLIPSKDDDDPDDNAPQQVQQAQKALKEFDDEELLQNIPSDWRMTEANIAQMPAIPVRLANGKDERYLPIMVKTYPKSSDSWTAYVRKVLSLGSGKSFKPTRQCDMPLAKPLLIQPLNIRQGLIESQSRFDMPVGAFFLALIEEANTSNADNRPDTDGDDGKWRLEIFNGQSGYKQMSVDPFYFYVTWIHEDDWHSYMTMLAETDTNPIRKFISYRDQVAYDTLDNLLLKVGERDLKIQGDLTPEEREKYGLDSNQAGDDADALRGRKIAAALKHKRLQGIDSQVKTYDFNNGETTIGVTLDEAKMAAASGKRAAELGQAAVMGGFSASNIASGLGWEKQRLASGFFSSEWLHLSAFSWGGFMPTGAKSGFSTSQNLENLIFGTSETNSLMTRYEMAWQDFYRKEQKIHEKIAKARNEDPKSLQGRLRIHCNNFSEPIRCDVNAGDKYRFTDFTIDQALVNKTALLAEENFQSQNPTTMRALYATRSDNSRTVNQDSRTPFTTEKEMLYLAHDFPAVVYSVEYAIENEFDSVLLDSKACASFSFYPFHRSLYHQAEAVLDALVWKKVKVMADFLVNRELEEEETDEEKALVEWRKKAIAEWDNKPVVDWRKQSILNGRKQARYGDNSERLELNYKSLRSRLVNSKGVTNPDEQQEQPKPKVRPFNILRFTNSVFGW